MLVGALSGGGGGGISKVIPFNFTFTGSESPKTITVSGLTTIKSVAVWFTSYPTAIYAGSCIKSDGTVEHYLRNGATEPTNEGILDISGNTFKYTMPGVGGSQTIYGIAFGD